MCLKQYLSRSQLKTDIFKLGFTLFYLNECEHYTFTMIFILSVLIVTFIPYFSHFAAVSLLGVAGLAKTCPSFSVSGPFLFGFPRYQIPPDCIVPSQLRSSSMALPLHLHFHNCSDVLSLISSFDVPEPFQPSPSHNFYTVYALYFMAAKCHPLI